MNTGRKNIFLPVSYPSSHSSKLSIPQVINGQRKIYSGSFDPSPSVRPIGPAFKKKVYLLRPRQVDSPFPSGFPWPGGMAEQCNRHRRKGGQCLSQASLHAAGVGEPRRAREGRMPRSIWFWSLSIELIFWLTEAFPSVWKDYFFATFQ